MGKLTTTITVTNLVDEIMSQRGFIPRKEVRSMTLDKVLVDTGATRICLTEDIISQLGLTLQGQISAKIAAKIAVGVRKLRVFRGLSLSVAGRSGTYDCIELPAGEDPLLGLIPLEDLGIKLDLQNQQLKLLPTEGKDTYLTIL